MCYKNIIPLHKSKRYNYNTNINVDFQQNVKHQNNQKFDVLKPQKV